MNALHSSCYQHADSSKPHLVLLHGWGAHSGVWQSVLETLLKNFTITCIDLPGHGHSGDINKNSVDGWADAVLDVAPEKAIWLGWSLGGLIAQQVSSRHPYRIEKLILLTSTPKFISSADWLDAVDEQVFRDFHAEVIRDSHASLLKFIALQTRGSATAAQDSRVLKKTLLTPEPSAKALDNGMQILLTTDLRDELSQIVSPVLWLAGQRDTLVPCSLIDRLESLVSDLTSVVIKQAGHAPFLSHPEKFCDAVINFCFNSEANQHKEAR